MIYTNDFKQLEIDPTTDIKQIKRAYAKRVKQCSPEEDAHNFQVLREAYERVLYYAESAASDERGKFLFTEDAFYEEYDSQEDQVYQSEPDVGDVCEQKEYSEDKSEVSATLISDFFRKVHELCSDFEKRNDMEAWTLLSMHEALWSLTDRQNVSKMFMDKIADGMFLNKKIIQLLNEHFRWEEEEEEFFEDYYSGFYKYIRECLDDNLVLGYDCLKPDSTLDINEFIRLREYGYTHFLEGDLDTADQYFRRAYELFSEESYLLCLMGAQLYLRNNAEEGQQMIERGIRAAQEPERMWLFCGQILCYSRVYITSIQYCKMLTPDSAHFGDALNYLTHSMCANNEHFSCYDMLEDLNKKGVWLSAVKENMRIIYQELSKVKDDRTLDYRMWQILHDTYPFIDSVGKNPIKPWAEMLYGIAILLILGIIIIGWIIVVIRIPMARWSIPLLWLCYKIRKHLLAIKRSREA